ncbi:hypothetical protein BDR07DRAFT_1064480 [Suillus spraguei]|nr:hypothetical protein BDR07DRAFT_1064480 [Suillus spraguei]
MLSCDNFDGSVNSLTRNPRTEVLNCNMNIIVGLQFDIIMATHSSSEKAKTVSWCCKNQARASESIVAQLANEHDGTGIAPAINLPANVAREDLEVLVSQWVGTVRGVGSTRMQIVKWPQRPCKAMGSKTRKPLGDAIKGHSKWVTSLAWEPLHLNLSTPWLASSSEDRPFINVVKWGGGGLNVEYSIRPVVTIHLEYGMDEGKTTSYSGRTCTLGHRSCSQHGFRAS